MIGKIFSGIAGIFGGKKEEKDSRVESRTAPAAQKRKQPKRANVEKMSREGSGNETGKVADKKVAQEVIEYIKEKIKSMGKIDKGIRDKAKEMVNLPSSVLKKIEVDKATVDKLKAKLSEDIGPFALLKFKDPLQKILKFYSKEYDIPMPA